MLKLQQMVDDMGRDKIRFEADMLKRLDEYKDFTIKSAKVLVDASCRDVVSGIEAEIVMPERFKAHLVGRSEPIFAALFEEIYVPKVAIVNEKIQEMQEWIRERNRRDVQVEGYLAGLERDLPETGAAIKTAFQGIIEELVFLRASATAPTTGLTTTTH